MDPDHFARVLDAPVLIDGEHQLTIRDIINQHFLEENAPLLKFGRKAAAKYIAALYTTAPEINQHIGWLKQYIGGMTEANWRDMKLHVERQLEKLEKLDTAIAATPADVLERIAREQSSDPATDDLTVPLAIELSEMTTRAFKAEAALHAATPAVGGEALREILAAAWLYGHCRARGFTFAETDIPGCKGSFLWGQAMLDAVAIMPAAQPAAPLRGRVLAPIEPTKEMIAAGDMLTYSQERFKVSEVYRAMIAALLASPPEQPAAHYDHRPGAGPDHEQDRMAAVRGAPPLTEAPEQPAAETRQQKNEREMAEGSRCDGSCNDGMQCHCQPAADPVTGRDDFEQVFIDACEEIGCAHDNESLLQAIADMMRRPSVNAYVADYEYRGDQDYKPNEHEQAMIEDAIEGYLAAAQDKETKA